MTIYSQFSASYVVWIQKLEHLIVDSVRNKFEPANNLPYFL